MSMGARSMGSVWANWAWKPQPQDKLKTKRRQTPEQLVAKTLNGLTKDELKAVLLELQEN